MCLCGIVPSHHSTAKNCFLHPLTAQRNLLFIVLTIDTKQELQSWHDFGYTHTHTILFFFDPMTAQCVLGGHLHNSEMIEANFNDMLNEIESGYRFHLSDAGADSFDKEMLLYVEFF